MKLLTGALQPDSGTVRLGANVQMASLDQGREGLGGTLAEALTQGRGDTVLVGGAPRHVMSYMKDFLFRPEQARTPVHKLSGGERGRLMLARALALPSNLLVLDEPTNDLDLETLDLLQEMLADYAGTVLLVSHDRDVLDRVVTSVVMAEGAGRWTEYAGGYTDMLAQRGRGVTPPKPVKREAAPKPATSPGPDRRPRLSFHEQHALKTLPGQIEALQAEIARLQARLADPGLYGRDRVAFDRATAALSAAESKLAAAEDEWLTLELRREELDG